VTVNPHTVNRVTAWIVLGWILLLGVWEVTVLALRTRYPEVRTISQEVKSIASRGMPSVAYLLTGMCAHWFITWRRLPWSGTPETVAAIAWWAGLAAYLFFDAITPEARIWIRHPLVAAIVGGVSAWLLFPQRSVWTW
jgi:hypothetical protein